MVGKVSKLLNTLDTNHVIINIDNVFLIFL